MKIALISVLSSDDASQNGVWGKMCAIQDGLKELNHDCDVFHLSNEGVQKNNITLIATTRHLNYRKLFISNSYIPLIKGFLIDYDLIWIRHAFYGPSLISILKKLKDNNPALKIVYELPTYPYIHEFKRVRKWFVKIHEHLIMNKLASVVNKIITYSDHQSIYNTPCITISNGISVNEYKVKGSTNKKEILKLIAIGVLWDWYGLDRVIEGLSDHKIKNGGSVTLSIVGEGPEINNLKALAVKLDLITEVKFLGWKNKSEIDELSNTHDVGIGTVAIHRKNVTTNSSLKHREYAARGLPFVFAGVDNDFSSACPFIHIVSSNEDPIDISSLLIWFNLLEVESTFIREYAELKLDWKPKLTQILSSL